MANHGYYIAIDSDPFIIINHGAINHRINHGSRLLTMASSPSNMNICMLIKKTMAINHITI